MEFAIVGGAVVVAAVMLVFMARKQKANRGVTTADAKRAARPTVPSTPSWVGQLQIETQGRRGAWLEISEGPQTGRTFFPGERTLTIGRGTTQPIQLLDRDVSRSHCRIAWDGAAWSVSDLSSGNGTWLNENRIASVPLEDGDVLRVGGTSLRFHGEAVFQVDYTLSRKEIGGAFQTAPHSVDLNAGGDGEGTSLKDRLLEVTRLTRAARTGLSGGELLEEISISLRAQLGADRTVILRRGIDTWDLHSFHHARDLSRERLRIPPDKPLMSRVAAAGEAMGTKTFPAETGFMCAIATPVRRKGQVIGVLYTDRVGEGESEFLPRDLEFLDSMAELVEPTLPKEP
ncbi:MAG: FHA domain-containing protein [Pseudomonadota bacterium]